MINIWVKLFNRILDSGEVPSDWSTGIMITLYKGKGSQLNPNNYRGITLLKPGANESQKTRNKKQNGLAYSRFIVCVIPKQKKHCLIRESCFSGTCAKQPINNISEVTWLCTWFPK